MVYEVYMYIYMICIIILYSTSNVYLSMYVHTVYSMHIPYIPHNSDLFTYRWMNYHLQRAGETPKRNFDKDMSVR